MLNLSRKSDYALIALTELARLQRDEEGAISARELAERFSLPPALLMNVLKNLARRSLVLSRRGVYGGYELKAAANEISVIDVVTAVDGPVRFAACSSASKQAGEGCELEAGCPIRSPIGKLHREIVSLLEKTTVADLLEDADYNKNGRVSATIELTPA